MVSQNDKQYQTSILIIGAGAAGLSAASRLLSRDISDFIILEAECRIGGRIYSTPFGAEGAFVELGAEWCHGDVDNAVYDIVRDHNLLAVTNPYVDIAVSDGSWLDKTHAHQLLNIFDDIYTPDGNKGEPEGSTVGDYFIKSYHDAVFAKYKGNPEKIKLSLLAIEALHKLVLTSEGSFSWFNTSATNDYRDCPGELLLNWKGKGYKQFLELMLETNNISTIENKLLLNKEVTNINWAESDNIRTSSRNVIVYCKDGSEFKAKHVIFTCSLGVLKNKATLFEPKLPVNKMEAIESLGFEGVQKVMIEFEKKWWPIDFTGVIFAWNQNDKDTISKEFSEGFTKHRQYSWLLDMMGVLTVENNPNVLSCWFLGNMVPEIERISDDIIKNGIVYLLQKFVGRKFKLTRPIGIKRMNWYTHPNFHGVYTFQTIKSRCSPTISSHVILGEPLYDYLNIPMVCFSGEATHPKYYSSVHGAVESGYREADRIAEFYSRFNSKNNFIQNKL